MDWFTRFLENDAESFKGKMLLLILDKLLVGAIIAVALVTYDIYRTSDQQAFQTEMADAQLEFERTRFAKELLPELLDPTTAVSARGYVLLSTLTAGHIDPETSINVASTLYGQGMPDNLVLRIAQAAIPAGLDAIAQRGDSLYDESVKLGMPDLPSHVTAIPAGPTGYTYVPSDDLSPELSALQQERLTWGTALRDTLQMAGGAEEREIASRNFLASNSRALYFLLATGRSKTVEEMFFGASPTLRYVGALSSIVNNWGPVAEAVDFFAEELTSLDLSDTHDLTFALDFISALRELGRSESEAQVANIAPEMSYYLARLLVDDSFVHRLPWISSNASPSERAQWWSEEPAADMHSTIQWLTSQVLYRMGHRSQSAEPVLISYLDDLAEQLGKATTTDALALIRSQHGKYAPRSAVAMLASFNTEASEAAIQRLLGVGSDKLQAFEGILMELHSNERFYCSVTNSCE